MKAAIFNPYLDTLGGGERYTMSFARVLVESGFAVDVEWKNQSIRKKLYKRFGIDMSGINFVKDINRGDGYDICFWLSDGSIPLLRARRNLLHFQFPFKGVNGRTLLNKMKLFRINKIICNSYFTKKFIDKEYGVESVVIYPPIDVESIKPKRKENIILSVGRFSQLTQSKNQKLLVEIFKNLAKDYPDWRLVLAGGTDVGVDDYVTKLRRSVKNYRVEIFENPTFEEIKILYGISKIFWSGVGFGVNENKEPMKVEHFGISVVEAMAAGCVPIIYSAGGYKEIVADGENGFLWKEKKDLSLKTRNIILNPRKMREIASNAREDAKVYEYERFVQEVEDLLK